jgi:glucose-1-phosphate cytidylyltransferase
LVPNEATVTTLILCGGRGTRAHPHTVDLPKPLLDVAGRPILRHVMQIFADQGFTRFVLAAGFRADLIAAFARDIGERWDIEVVDTGEDANKGDRILMCREHLTDTFFATYGDGVGDVDLAKLLDFHHTHGGLATVTVVPLPSQYGTMDFDDSGRVHAFIEKPRLIDHWINAGFFAMDERVFEHWPGGDLETTVLPALGSSGELFAYKHDGFWKSMDTFKDAQDLTSLAEAHGKPPWLRSGISASSKSPR